MTLVPASSHASGGGAATTLATTAPLAPTTGDLWLNTTAISGTTDRPLSVWSGSAWIAVALAHYDGTPTLRGFATLTDGGLMVEHKDAAGLVRSVLSMTDTNATLRMLNAAGGLTKLESSDDVILTAHGVDGVQINADLPANCTFACRSVVIQPQDLTFPAFKLAGVTSAPSAANLVASDLSFWLTDTPGATRVGVAAKDSGGTAVNQTLEQASPITSGTLPTQQLVSGTGAQLLVARAAESVTPVTFNPGAATTATCTVALSPDNVTYSTLGVETEPAGVAFDGTIHLVKVRVPAGWYLKLTANAQAVLGLTTYY